MYIYIYVGVSFVQIYWLKEMGPPDPNMTSH